MSIGDTKEDLIEKCGKPTSVETPTPYWKSKERVGSLDIAKPPEYVKRIPGGVSGGKAVYEFWYYNCGKNHFSVKLTITNSQIGKIETLGYGSGESDCIGAKKRK